MWEKLFKNKKKKYKLTNESIEIDGVTLYRIEALRDFGCVKKGDKGGFVESENNLAYEGNAWVFGSACVYGNASVGGNAWVSGSARVFGNANVCDDSRIFGNAWVYDNARVYGNALVYGESHVFGNALVYGESHVYGNAWVYDNARVSGDTCVCGSTNVCGDAEISTDADYIVFKNWWSSGRYFTWTRSNNMWSVGCFYGTGEELIKKAYKDSELSGRQYERLVKYVEETLKDEENGE